MENEGLKSYFYRRKQSSKNVLTRWRGGKGEGVGGIKQSTFCVREF